MAVDAVIFDWGGTLTPWITLDDRSWWRIAAELAAAGVIGPERVDAIAGKLYAAEVELWRQAREEHTSGSLADLLAVVGLSADEAFYAIHSAEFEPATYTDPEAAPLLAALRERGIRVGVLSNTHWSRAQHERIFVRDGVHHLIDGAVYTSEIPWVKPHPEAFRAAMTAIGVSDPARCVFVGDRPFDDIYGARQVGMRAVLVPHSTIPTVQHGHTQGVPDATVQRLADLLAVIDDWHAT